MVSTRQTLEQFSQNIDESMGQRRVTSQPQLSPRPAAKDMGLEPTRQFGRISIDKVVPDPHQPRKQFSPEAIGRLAASLKSKGQLAPIRVRWSDEVNRWVIISGQRRWMAAMQAGLRQIDCSFVEGTIPKSDVLQEQLIENCLREDLQPIEEAKAYAALMSHNGWTGKQLSELLSVPASRISRALALLRLPEDIQSGVAEGRISARSAYELSKLDNPDQQRSLAAQAATRDFIDTEKAVRQRRGKPVASRSRKLTFPTESGWTVTVSSRRKGTYHEVEEALQQALDEVRIRIQNNVQLF